MDVASLATGRKVEENETGLGRDKTRGLDRAQGVAPLLHHLSQASGVCREWNQLCESLNPTRKAAASFHMQLNPRGSRSALRMSSVI
jgi:hypothetical protein